MSAFIGELPPDEEATDVAVSLRKRRGEARDIVGESIKREAAVKEVDCCSFMYSCSFLRPIFMGLVVFFFSFSCFGSLLFFFFSCILSLRKGEGEAGKKEDVNKITGK